MNTKTVLVTAVDTSTDTTFIRNEGIVTAPVEMTFVTASAASFNPMAIKTLVDYGDGSTNRRDMELIIRPKTFTEVHPPITPLQNPVAINYIHDYLPGESFLTPITAQFIIIYGNLVENTHNIVFQLRQSTADEVIGDPHVLDTQLLPAADNKVFMSLEAGNNGFGFNIVVDKTNTVDPI